MRKTGICIKNYSFFRAEEALGIRKRELFMFTPSLRLGEEDREAGEKVDGRKRGRMKVKKRG